MNRNMKKISPIILIIILLIAAALIFFVLHNNQEKGRQENKISQEEHTPLLDPLLDIYGEILEINDKKLKFAYSEFNEKNEIIGTKLVELLITDNTKITIQESTFKNGTITSKKYDSHFSDIKVGSKVVVFSESDMRGKAKIEPKEIRIIILNKQ